MLIASKYEEIYAPEVRDFVYITDKAYDRDQVLTLERDILRKLDFNICVPSIYRFLERYTKISQSDELIFAYAQYMCELSILEVAMY